MIILSKLRVKGCVSSWLKGRGRGNGGREGGDEAKGKKSGENKIHWRREAVFVRAG